MAFALVGTRGAVSVGVAGASVTPAWGASETRVAGNLLVCWVAIAGSSNAVANDLASLPAGWNLLASPTPGALGSSFVSSYVFWRLATGTDAAPTLVPLQAADVISAAVAEFSGEDVRSTPDQTGVNTGGFSLSPLVVKNGAVDNAIGELFVASCSLRYSAAATKTFTPTMNNGMTANALSSAAVSTQNHYYFVYGITTSIAAADQLSLAYTTTNGNDQLAAAGSFNLAGVAAPRRRNPLVSRQAVLGAATRCWKRRQSGIVVPRLWTPEGATI